MSFKGSYRLRMSPDCLRRQATCYSQVTGECVSYRYTTAAGPT